MVARARTASQTRLTANAGWLEAPAYLAMRAVAQRHWREAQAAARRLGRRQDGEALHDFRVALRRLRSHLSAHRTYWKIPPRLLKRLKRLTQETNAARDTEVFVEWLEANGPKDERDAIEALYRVLQKEAAQHAEQARRLAKTSLEKIAHLLRRALSPPDPVTRSDQAPYRTLWIKLLRERQAAFEKKLAEVKSFKDGPTLHAARIRAKRLRYLLEPVVREVSNGESVLASLKKFQDDVGRFNDNLAMRERLIVLVEQDAAARARRRVESMLHVASVSSPPRPVFLTEQELLQLGERLRSEASDFYQHVNQHYLVTRPPEWSAFRAALKEWADAKRRPRPVSPKKPPRKNP
jgi:CHAD domain-containing protein